MCAILDANVVTKVFGSRSSTEGRQFFDWLDSRKGRLVIGGKVKRELYQHGDFERWARDESRAKRLVAYDRESKKMRFASVVEYNDTEIEAEILKIKEQKLPFDSNDLHVIALARVSGARLLYSEDKFLRKDFKKKHLVNSPRGKLYSKANHKRLVNQKDLCRQ